MRLRQEQLDAHLARGLAPVYLVSSDEPLLQIEAADAIRAAARRNGYTSREILEADARFDWQSLSHQAEALSLFAERKLVDLRIPSGKPGREGGQALRDWCQAPPEDLLLLITVPRLDRSQLASAWVKAIDQAGVVLQLWPPDAARLPGWIQARLRAAGLEPAPGVAELLAERTEGNLLAARQEIEKLVLLHGRGPVSLEAATRAVADSARYDAFTLVDAALAGDARRTQKILAGLRAEGTPAPVVLWALARALRELAAVASLIGAGQPETAALNRAGVWKNRQPLVRKALGRGGADHWRALLRRCRAADAAIKGAAAGADPWLRLEEIALALAGLAAMGIKKKPGR